MPKKKKLFNYKFIDCEKSLPSSIVVKCTQTGEEVRMYHKQLVRLIEKKYRNNYSLFRASYIKKGNKPEINNIDENGEYNTAPEGYRQYLIIAYKFAKQDSRLDDSMRAERLNFLSECYSKRYNASLEKVFMSLEQ